MQRNREDQLPEIKLELLENEKSFQKWKFVMETKFKGHPTSRDILDGTVTFEEGENGVVVNREGAVLTAEARKRYICVEEQMKAILVQGVEDKYALPLLSIPRFIR